MMCFKIQTIDLKALQPWAPNPGSQLFELVNPREREVSLQALRQQSREGSSFLERLKYGFGFYAEIRPSSAISAEVDEACQL